MARSVIFGDMATRGKQGLTACEISYLAGMVDADGCISIYKSSPTSWGLRNARIFNPKYVLRVNVVNTSIELMEWLVEKFGGRYKGRRMSKPDKQKETFDWYYDNGKALGLLEIIEPYLIVKQSRAQLGIEFIRDWKTNHGQGAKVSPDEVCRRDAIYVRMKELNQFGPVQPQRLSPKAPV